MLYVFRVAHAQCPLECEVHVEEEVQHRPQSGLPDIRFISRIYVLDYSQSREESIDDVECFVELRLFFEELARSLIEGVA